MTYGKCASDDCSNAAQFAPKICAPATGYPPEERYSLSGIFGLELCKSCCEKFPAAEQFTNPKTADTWTTIFNMLLKAKGRGAIPPDYTRAFVVCLPLDSKEYLTFKSMQATKQ